MAPRGVFCFSMWLVTARGRTALAASAVLLAALAAPGAAFGVDVAILGSESCPECFSPANVSVDMGDTITWYNNDGIRHTVTSGPGAPDGMFYSGFVAPGESFSFAPRVAGEYRYYCLIHPWMIGTISAQPAPAEQPRLLSRTNDLLDAEMYAVSGEPYVVFTRFVDSVVATLDVSSMKTLDIRNGSAAGGLAGLNGPQDVEVFQNGERPYALVVAYVSDTLHVLDVTDPADMAQVAAVRDGAGGFEALGGARDAVVHYTMNATYAYVTSVFDNAVQIVNITDPAAPTPVGMLEDRSLASSPIDVSLLRISGVPYLLITDIGETAARIMDISDPINPVQVGVVGRDHPAFAALHGSTDVQRYDTPQGVHVVAANAMGDSIAILNMADPANPSVASIVRDGEDGFDALAGPGDVELFEIYNRTYVLVASPLDKAIQVVDVTDPANPIPVSVLAEWANALDVPWDTEIFPSGTRALVMGSAGSVLQIINLENVLQAK